MNRIYRSIWNDKTGTFVAASENVKGAGKRSSSGTSPASGSVRFMLKGLVVSLMLAFGGQVYALPTGGVVSAGSAGIAGGTGAMTVNQASQNVAINWQGFSIGSGEAVRFVQPNSSSVALNRVLGSDPSSILGSLSANGKVFLVNPNGILFGQDAAVNVGGLVASTLNIRDRDFMAGNYEFSGAGKGTVENQGAINADGGYVALLGAKVSNQGVISARLGTVALVAGQAVTLDLAGDGLLNVAVSQGAVNALVDNGGLIRTDGGQVLLTAQAAGNLLQSAVNNTGVIQAQTLQNHNGTIKLLGDMQSGTVNVGGKLDASAPNGGNGGFIETSAAHVKVADEAIVTTHPAQGSSGTWLIDPTDFTIATTGGDMTGTALSNSLAGGAVTILSSTGASGTKGDINVNAPVSWSANMLTLTATHDININAAMTASGAASLALNPGGAGMVVTGRDSLGNFIGHVDFSGAGTLAIGGTSYTIINSLGAPGSVTGADLQGINGSAGNLAGHYALGKNIDATATGTAPWGAGFLPIGVFTGTFDGLGHTITGLTINRSGTADVGLFGNVAPGTSTLRNVALVGGSVTGAAGTGGLIGNSGAGVSVNNVSNTGSVSGAAGSGGLIGSNGAGNAIGDSYATGSVSGAAGTGGLVGSNGAGSLVSNSYAIGNVTGAAGAAGVGGLLGSNGDLSTVSKSYAAGSVTMSGAGGASVGGLVGSNTTAAVNDSYATGNIVGNNAADVGGLIGSNTSGAVHNTYAVGGVSGSGAGVGALVGSSNAGTVTDSYWNSDTSITQLTAGGGIGMTTANMKKQLDFTSATAANNPDAPTWDFANTWVMYEGVTYPLLRPFMRPLTVTANSASATYNGVAQTGGGVSYSSTPNANLLGTVSMSGGGTSVGRYAITPSGLYSNQQGYIIDYVNGTMSINPASLTVTAANVSKPYGQTTTPTAFTAAGLVGGDTIGLVTESSAGTAATASVAGSPYAITPSAATGGSFIPANYSIGYVDGALTVVPIALTVTASNVTKNYGQTSTLGAFTAAGLANGDTVGGVTETSPGAAATASVAGGPYAITPSAATGGSFVPSNYTIGYVDGALAVIPGALTVTASDVTKIYGQTPTLNAFTAAGLVNGDTVGLVTETSPGQPATAGVAGSPYAITPSGATGSFVPANYTIAYVNGVLTVMPTPLTIASPDVTMTYGQSPVLSTFTPTGLLNGDTVGSITGTSPGTLVGASSAGGSYAITPSSATGGSFVPANYATSYVNGVLTVTPAIVPSETIPVMAPGAPPAMAWMPGIVLAGMPPELLTVASAAPVEAPAVVQEQPTPSVEQPTPIVAPVETPPKPYVAPRRPRKQDLN
ncbi:MAG TPA: MBG domain-containing protein [Rhodocyclaceae bacterium]|nr:MBG domain-containing protein [Rhodocyclaceae bacterium]HUY02960.1 MBG domain-containing protein [Rhodocyclaceae bacterium]